MPVIIANKGIITQINVFTTPAGQQQPLIDLLTKAANWASTTQGWMSASLHRSLDGTRVVNYAQCENQIASESVIARLKEGGYFERNAKLGVTSPGLYETVYTLDR
jgi:hypothetical protein